MIFLKTTAFIHYKQYIFIVSSFRNVQVFSNINIFRYLHVLNEFTPERQFCSIPDISYGKENVPVSCVNSIDNAYPEYVEYSTVRSKQLEDPIFRFCNLR
jgi:histone-lysine N-methyltransferase SETDB1